MTTETPEKDVLYRSHFKRMITMWAVMVFLLTAVPVGIWLFVPKANTLPIGLLAIPGFLFFILTIVTIWMAPQSWKFAPEGVTYYWFGKQRRFLAAEDVVKIDTWIEKGRVSSFTLVSHTKPSMKLANGLTAGKQGKELWVYIQRYKPVVEFEE